MPLLRAGFRTRFAGQGGLLDTPMFMPESRAFSAVILISFLLLLATSCSRPQTQGPVVPKTSPASANEQTISGRVVRIADGDTVTVLDASNTQHRIRLQGIDAPESHQDFGTQSKKNLSSMIFGRDVTVVYEKSDRYGRLVGKVLFEGRDINLEQVRSGMAWHYKEYEREQSLEDRDLYARAEDDARSARRGLWIDPNPIVPGEFRKNQKQSREDAR